MRIVHFDADEVIRQHLPEGECTDFSLTENGLSHVSDPETIELVTIKSQSKITLPILCKLPKLKYIITRTVGIDHIDLAACRVRQVHVSNVPDYGNHNIAEHTLGLILSGARHIPQADREVHGGIFSYRHFPGVGIRGKTVGIVGTGRIGMAVMKLLQPFGVTILAYDVIQNLEASDMHATYVPLPELLARSDIVTIHVPSIPQTHHMFSEKELGLMKPGAILVNTARGAVIDTPSLVAAADKFSAICLDVLEDEENFTAAHPLLSHANVIITPHIAFYTDDSVKRIGEQTMTCINQYRSGVVTNEVQG